MAQKRRRCDQEDYYEEDSQPRFFATEDEAELAEKLEGDIVKNINVPWSSICGLENVQQLLEETTVLPLLRPDLFTGIFRPAKGILLYGPPGTGKTSLAKAVATQCGTTFFNVSLATINSKWVGEGEKMVRMLFRLASFYSPSVVFIDEVDAICSSSKPDDDRKIQAELLVQMDGLDAADVINDDEDPDEDNTRSEVVVIAATNKPWNIEPAFRRRFERRIYVPLPDGEVRHEIVQKYIKDLNVAKSFDIKSFAKKTLAGYSGADIYTVCRAAAMCPVRRKLAEKGGTMKILKFTKNDMRGQVIREDFESSVKQCNKTVCPDDVDRFFQWTKMYGSEVGEK